MEFLLIAFLIKLAFSLCNVVDGAY